MNSTVGTKFIKIHFSHSYLCFQFRIIYPMMFVLTPFLLGSKKVKISSHQKGFNLAMK